MTKRQQLYQLWHKAGLVKGKKTTESSKALDAIKAMFEAKQITVAIRAYIQMKIPMLITEIIQPLTERETRLAYG